MIKQYAQTLIYGITAAFIVLTGFILPLFVEDSIIDITVHDTYLVIGSDFIATCLGILFFLYSFFTWTQEHFHRKPNKLLFVIHYLTTVTGMLLVSYAFLHPSQPTSYYDYSVQEIFDNQIVDQTTTNYQYILLTVIIAIQFLFFINIIASFFKSEK